MLYPTTPSADIGIVVGRFQVPYLHDGHGALIESVMKRHKKVLVLIGKTPGVLVTKENPLDYHTRMLMIRKAYPDISILPINDLPSHKDWSRAVDGQISLAFDGADSVLLYGSRDSFIPYYSGKWPTVELEQSRDWSATKIRKMVSDDVRNTDEFRRGVIYASFNRHPIAYPTVDAAVIDFGNNEFPREEREERIFLGRKNTDPEGQYRFPGGFVDVQDDSMEQTVIREVREELLGIEVDKPQFVGTHKVDDWRYKGKSDGIITTLFVVPYLWGHLKAGDDLDECKAFPLASLKPDLMMHDHKPLVPMLLSYLKKETNNV